MASSTDVPGKYDLVANGQGYVFLDSVEPSIPFRTHRAIYDISQTFVQRQNVSNSYGDNAQDFFLTARQRDWSFGEQQKFFRNGQDGRYWMGNNVDVGVPGQVRLAPDVATLTFAAAAASGSRLQGSFKVAAATSTRLYQVDEVGGITDLGLHGLGAAPSKFGVCSDGTSNYLTTTAAGTVGVRKWNGAVFSTFSASAADAIEYLNNTLFGYRSSNGDLVSWDSSGALSSLYTWKGGDGTATGGTICRLSPFGGKLLILFAYGREAAELWIWDGVAASRLEVFPENFVASDMEVLYGVVYIGGAFVKPLTTTTLYAKPAVLFFDGSQIGRIWEAADFNATSNSAATYTAAGPSVAVGISNGRLLFTDETTGNLMAYNPVSGGISSISTYTPNAGSNVRLISTGQVQVHIRNQTGGYFLPAATYPASGYVISSLVDFDSSLSKQFRGVTVQFDAAADGDGGSVDIAYQVDSLTGSWTTLRAAAVSGTEYTFSNVSGHAVAVKVTLNKGTSAAGPTLRNMNLRAAPILRQFRSGTYILDCTNTDRAPRKLRDGTDHPLSGYDQVKNLLALAQSTTPFTVTDRLGTFTALVDLNDQEGFDVYEVHPSTDNPQKPGSYVARVKVREV